VIRNPLTRLATWLTIAAFTSANVMAGPVDLANNPMTAGSGVRIPPNVLFILDDSSSMNREYMPEEVGDNNGDSAKACYRNFGYNKIYYNPSTTYLPPVNADGSSFPNASFAGALTNGFDSASAATDLSIATPNYGPATTTLGSAPFSVNGSTNRRRVTVTHTNHGLSPGATVTFTGLPGSGNLGGISWSNVASGGSITVIDANRYYFSQGTNATSTTTGGGSSVVVHYQVVVSTTPTTYYYSYTANPTNPSSTCATDASYARVNVTAASSEAQNYANWYSYYRTRLLMMKSASGRAFKDLDGNYRVGFSVINDTGTSNFLGVSEFDATQKGLWYTKLYDTSIAGIRYTPLRGALSKAGRYFAGTLPGATDPVQYSCQQNFSILTTDGFWNIDSATASTAESLGTNATTNYGPYREDNLTLVGDQDDTANDFPYYDGPNGTLNASKVSNSLSDIAMYYWKTDLRSTMTNNVPTSNTDPANWQHMTTFTMGMGVSGSLNYPNAWAGILQGTTNWPNPQVTDDDDSVITRIDDLWHAGVNGHGQYFSASNPDAVEAQLSNALSAIEAKTGSSAAAATSNLQPVEGDNTAFIAQYKTVEWTGDVLARSINVGTGAISTTNLWSAQQRLDAQVAANARTEIYMRDSAAASGRKDFNYANLSMTQQAWFAPSLLSQYATLTSSPVNQLANATAANLVSYLRGTRIYEDQGTAIATDIFRKRTHVLGDIVSAAPVYVRKAPFSYTDTGYAAYISSTNSRVPTVYVGGNDGMLHAINASSLIDDGTGTGTTVVDSNGGKERWAYIPSMVLPNIHKLADKDYAHRFFVDGPIAVGDAYNTSTSAWSTILVGGLGNGGRGYYAIDITTPTNPKVLWEFGTGQSASVGFSYGNPIITKRRAAGDPAEGRWVVVFASGYNNNDSGTGDGKGRLYVVDAFSGAKLGEIITDNGVTNPDLSGIARVSNFVANSLQDNTTQYVYGGDLAGNLWRFDINVACNPCTTGAQQRLGYTPGTAGTQPITVQPELAKIDGNRVVYFGTGRFLGPSDFDTHASTDVQQAVYAVKDMGTDLGSFTSASTPLVAQTLNASSSPRTITSLQPVNWGTSAGWYVTAPQGERFNVDPGLQLGTLVIAANITAADECTDGSSVLYQLDYRSGNVLMTNSYSALIVGTTQLQTGGGSGPVVIDPVFATGTTGNTTQVTGTGGVGGVRRVSWREIE